MAKKSTTPEPTVDEVEDEVVETPPAQQVDTNWEDRFKGLQRTYAKAQKKLETLEEEKDDLLEETETSKQSALEKEAKLKELQDAQDKAQADLDRLTGELTTQEAKNKRANLILADFPDLARFEADGLLPTADTDEELIEKFTKFRDTLKSSISSGVEQQIVGASPADAGSTATTPVRTKQEIYARLTALAGRRTPEQDAEYTTLMDEWDELNKLE